MSKLELKIDESLANRRLDIAIALARNDLSRSIIKKYIDSNQVHVNGVVEYRANYKVKEGDMIYIESLKIDSQSDKLIPENINLEIIYEDKDLIVINKAPGMPVHPGDNNWNGTVMNGIVYKYKELENIGESHRSGLIHRLDKDTSGVLLIGKTNLGLWHYSKQFAERKVEKYYLALSKGQLNSDEFNIINYVARNKVNRKKMTVVAELDASRYKIKSKKYQKLRNSQYEAGRARAAMLSVPGDARIAETKFKLLESVGNNHLILAQPKTGRTHQIRVHLSNIDLPIVGDNLYGGIESPRMMLHAFAIKVMDPDGKVKKFIAKPDNQFDLVLKESGIEINYEQLKI